MKWEKYTYYKDRCGGYYKCMVEGIEIEDNVPSLQPKRQRECS